MTRAAAAVLLGLMVAGCDPTPSANGATSGPATPQTPKKPEIVDIDLQALAGFQYVERMELPPEVMAWNGKRVKATGFLNPTQQVRGINQFFLVKDRASCCFGTRPQINHYVDVTLTDGKTIDYTTDPVMIVGTFRVEDRWDGDWQLGLYWIEDGEVYR